MLDTLARQMLRSRTSHEFPRRTYPGGIRIRKERFCQIPVSVPIMNRLALKTSASLNQVLILFNDLNNIICLCHLKLENNANFVLNRKELLFVRCFGEKVLVSWELKITSWICLLQWWRTTLSDRSASRTTFGKWEPGRNRKSRGAAPRRCSSAGYRYWLGYQSTTPTTLWVTSSQE